MNTIEVEWTPPIETGISGDSHPTNELEPFINEYEEAKQPGVYILRLSQPNTNDITKHKTLWKQTHNRIPEYIHKIAARDKILYVGAAENIINRLYEHIDESVDKSSTVMKTYPPHSLIKPIFTNSKETAFDKETQVELSLKQTYPNAYVHCR